MKKTTRILSFILVLSLLFSSLAFTVGALDTSPSNDLGIDEDVEYFDPTAQYDQITTEDEARQRFPNIRAPGSSVGLSYSHLWGENDLESYYVTGTRAENLNEYVMLIPSENSSNSNVVTNHSYFDVNVNKEITYTGTASDTRYIVLEIDIATESNILPMFYQVTARHRAYSGSSYAQDFAFPTSYTGGSDSNSMYANMTPGVFHRFALIGDTYTNNLYVYLDDKLIDVQAESVIENATGKNYYDNYLNAKEGTKILLQGFRIQMNNSVTNLNGNMSICYDNIKCYTLLNDSSSNGNLDTVLGGSLENWSYSGYTKYDEATAQKLPDLININGTNYTNIPEAEVELNTFELGNEATVLHDVYSGNITVNSDAVIHTSGASVSFTEGDDVKLTKADGTTWVATLTGNKYSATIKSVNQGDITSSLIFNHKDNLILSINQTRAINAITVGEPLTEEEWETAVKLGLDSIIGDDKYISNEEIAALSETDRLKFTDNSVDGIVFKSYDGIEYLVIRDNTDAVGDFAPNVHYQVNANTNYLNHQSDFLLAGHKFVVFDQDIYTESEFINVYNGFNIRTTSNTPLTALSIYAEDITVDPGEWHHVTYIGEIETGHSYLFLDGKFVGKVTGGLYDEKALSDNGGTYETMVLASFRALQVAGSNKTGTLMTPEMSAGADNFCLRWADDADLISFVEQINADLSLEHSLSEWTGNIYDDSHVDESIVIATIDGVRYYDTASMTAALTAPYSDTRMRNVIFYRDYVGTITVNCRALINVACLTSSSKLVYSDTCEITSSADGKTVTVEKKPINTTLIQANKSNTNSGIAFGTGNLYAGHDVAGEAWMVTDQGYSYLWDTGVDGNTHTLPITGGNLSSNVTHSVSKANGSFTSSASVTVKSTETQYYYTLEFDIAKKSDSASSVLTFNLNFGGTNKSYTIDLSSVLASLEIGEFTHITVIGTVDVVTNISYNVTASTSGLFGATTTIDTATAKNTAHTYTVGSVVYVDDVKNNSLSKASVVTFSNTTEAGTEITWSNVALNVPTGSQILLDNVYASTKSTTTVYTTEYSARGSSAGTTLTNNFTNNHPTSNDLGGTGTDDQVTDSTGVIDASNSDNLSANSGFGSDVTAAGAISDSYEMPTDEVLEYLAENAIAYIDSTPYTSWSDLVTAINNKYSENNKAIINVTVVKLPDSAITLTANVIFHTGGHFKSTDNLVKAGSGCLLRADDALGTIEIIVLGNTSLIATFNGVDYTDEDTLGDVLSIARNAELTFYSTPSVPYAISCPSVINTNGLDAEAIYTTEEFQFQITIDGNVHTLVDESRVGKVIVNLVSNSGTVTTEYELPYGTDIASYLTKRGIKGSAYVTDDVVYTDITWSPEPSGRVQSAQHVFTATAASSEEIEEGSSMYIDADGNKSAITSETEFIQKLSANGDGTIIINSDIIMTTLNSSLFGSGTKNIYLNGHTIKSTNKGNHLFSLSGSGNYNFYGPGSIDFTEGVSTHALFFMNYNYTGTVTLDGLTIDSTQVIGTIRNGHMVVRHCDISVYAVNGMSGVFSLAEDYTNPNNGNHDYSGNPGHGVEANMSLTISESDISYRYANVTDRYGNFSADRPFIHYKNVTSSDKTADASDPVYLEFDCKVFIDKSNVFCQGSLISADASDANLADAYKHSNLKVYLNESTIISKALYAGKIKQYSIIVYDDVRTNVTDTDNIAFAINLVKAKTSDGLSKVLYTSHDYATVTWNNASGGTQEYWASGSIPTHSSYKFFSTGVVTKGQDLDFSDTLGGQTFPFKLFCNLNLSNSIGFNVHIPTTSTVKEIYLNGVLMTQGTYSDGTPRISPVTSNGTEIECYDFSIQLAPQEAGKELTLLIKLENGLQVSRSVSVGEYAKKLYAQAIQGKLNSSDTDEKSYAIMIRDLLHVALSYIEQSTMYAGYRVDMSDITEVMNLSDMGSCSYTPTTNYTDYSESFKTAFTGILKGVQLNVADTSAIRFNLANGVTLENVSFKIVDDNGNLVSREATIGDGYVEISLRAYEMSRDIEVTINGVTSTYNLFTYKAKLASMIATEANGGTGIVTGRQREYVAAEKLVDVMLKYAGVADYYLKENPDETVNPNA